MTEHKNRVSAAINKYYDRQRDKENKQELSRKNKAPEKDTEREVLAWAKQNNIYLHVVDSSAGYNRTVGRRDAFAAPVGYPDLSGNNQAGLAFYIELKARQRRATLRDHQRHFLEQKIYQCCFAVCVDSADRLDQYYRGWSRLKTPRERVDYLLDCLPKKRPTKDLNFD